MKKPRSRGSIAQVALELSESIEYCSENERCQNAIKFITPPPNPKSHSLQWDRWLLKTLLEDIQDSSKRSIHFLDGSWGRFLPTLTSPEMLVWLMYYQQQWRQVLMRKSIFKSIKSNPHLNLEIGDLGPQLKSSLVPFSQERSSFSANNRTLKPKIPALTYPLKLGCQLVICTQDLTTLLCKGEINGLL